MKTILDHIPHAPVDGELCDWIARHASHERADELVLTVPDAPEADLTWRALAAAVDRAAQALAARGVRAGDCVPCEVGNSPEFFIQWAASQRIDAIFAPLNPRWSERERRAALAQLLPAAADDPDPPRLILFTSGSRGEPRAVPLTRANLAWSVAQFTHSLALRATDRHAAISPLCHVAGLCTMALPSLWLGARVVIFARFDVEALARAVACGAVNTTFMVPTMWRALAQHEAFERGELDGAFERALVGGAPCSRGTLEAWAARGVRLQVGYGMTEAAPMVTVEPEPLAHRDIWRVGHPGLAVEVEVDAEQRILVRGPNVMQGYWRGDAPRDRARFDARGFFITGDRGELGEDGALRWLGRWDDVILTGGENVSPIEVEAALCELEGVELASVVGVKDARWGEAVVAAVVWRAGCACDEVWARDAMRERLASYKVPRCVVSLAALPSGATHKLDRAALTRQLQELWDGGARTDAGVGVGSGAFVL